MEKSTVKTIPFAFIASHKAMYDTVIARNTSLEEAIILPLFLSKWKRHKKEGKGWIVIAERKMAEAVGLSLYQLRKVLKRWKSLGILETRLKGAPPTKWYHLHEQRMAKYISMIYQGRKL